MSMHIVIEPIPGNPGYIAAITGNDPEIDPIGSGATRMAAAVDEFWQNARARIVITWAVPKK
jgi:hypothetical protein